MKAPQKLILWSLLALMAAAVVGLILTGRPPDTLAEIKRRNAATVHKHELVDQSSLEIAEELAALAGTPAEQDLAQNAVRLADHEVDLAFTSALRTASGQSGRLNGEAATIQARIQRIQTDIAANQEKVKRLTAEATSPSGKAGPGPKAAKVTNTETFQQQIELAQAELALNQDELEDAQQDLVRSGGDAYSSLQSLWQQHEAGHQKNGSSVATAPGTRPEPVTSSSSFLARWRMWSALRAKQGQLVQAQQSALNAAQALTRDHDALEQRVGKRRSRKQTLTTETTSSKPGQAPEGVPGSIEPPQPDTLSTLRRLSDDEKNLADLDRRMQDLRQLGAIYGQWITLVAGHRRAALHAMIKSAFWILLVVMLVLLADHALDRLYARVALERRQQHTLRSVLRFAVRALATVVIVLLILGAPTDITTALGLAGAGLTVALKDFLVSFLGWFVLMGHHGIRVGDWVEINGVRGEVMQISLLRTILLETGNWTEAGHPTGREVAFLNSYAVQGYYFNFTTSGQWLWDELQVLVPWDRNPYPIIEKLQAIVARETADNISSAAEEWRRVTHRYGVKSFAAEPAVNVRTTEAGLELTLRYVTRAEERSAVRLRLNHAIVRLLHRNETGGATEPAVLPAGDQVENRTAKP